MGRWEPDAQGRLRRAALELFADRGYEATTVAGIAEAAGLSERTFFRHFADKREVLFAGSEHLEASLVEAVSAAPDGSGPLDTIGYALVTALAFFEGIRDFSRQRQAIVDANAELREREVAKLAHLARAMAGALRRRGVEEPAASLAAEAGVAVFRVGFERWTADPEGPTLRHFITEGLDQVRAMARG